MNIEKCILHTVSGNIYSSVIGIITLEVHKSPFWYFMSEIQTVITFDVKLLSYKKKPIVQWKNLPFFKNIMLRLLLVKVTSPW